MRRTALARFTLTLALALALALAPAPALGQGGDAADELVRRVLTQTPLFDGHNDLPWAIREHTGAPGNVEAYDLRGRAPGHTDIPRLRKGMVGAQFWSVYIPFEATEEGAARVQLEQIDIARRVIARYPDVFEQAYSVSDVERIFGSGRIASVLGMEGGHAIENSLGALRAFYDLGVRYLTLTHSANIDWADSCCEPPRLGGLSEFGKEVVREMNRLGMLVDLSHTSPGTMHDALDVSEAPVIFSHSGARAVTDHPRNVPDDVLRRLPENGGVVMVTFVPSFVNAEVMRWSSLPPEQRKGSEPRATMEDVIRHIEHIRRVAGVDHVGIGGDFDGISAVVQGLEDVSTYPALFAELARRGWTEEELAKLAGGNVMRVWREVERVAARLQRERPPSVKTIEELDGRKAGEPRR